MPGAIAAVGAVVAAVGSSAVGAFVVKTALAVGFSFASRLLAGKPKFGKGKGVNSLTLTVKNSTEPRRLVYGRSPVPGLWTYVETTGDDNEFLHLVLALCEGPIDAIESVYFDDYELQLDADGYEVSDYDGLVRVRKHLGDEVDADVKLNCPHEPVFEAHAWRGYAASGGKVSQFGDFVQSTGSDQPTDSTIYPTFNGGESTHNWMSVADAGEFSAAGNFEVCLKCQLSLDENNRTRTIFSKYYSAAGADRVFLVRWLGSSDVFQAIIGDASATDTVNVPGAATIGTDVDIYVTYDGSTLTLSVNGSSASKSSLTSTPDMSRNVAWAIGTHGDSGGTFPLTSATVKTWRGPIYGVAVFDKVLTAGERTDVFDWFDNYGVDPTTDALWHSGDVNDGDLIQLSGTLPGGLSAGDYYAIDVDTDTFRLSSTVNAQSLVDITGTPTQTFTITKRAVDAALYRASNNWTVDHRLLGTAYLYLRLEYKQKKFPDGLPEIWAVVNGRNDIYDPRDGSTGYTDNSALCLRHYLMLPDIGPGLLSAEIDDTAVTAAANICDQSVSLKAGGSESRYTCNGVITLDDTPEDIVQRIKASMAGWSVWADGKVVMYAGAHATPTFTVTEDMVIGRVRNNRKIPRRDRVNYIKGTFISEDTSWQPFSFPASENFTYETEDGERHIKDVEFTLTQSGATAQRLAKIELEAGRKEGRLELDCNLRAFAAIAGTNVYVTIPRLGYDSAIFRVVESALSFGDQPGVKLSLQETGSDIYDWTPASDEVTLKIPADLGADKPTVSEVTINPWPDDAEVLLLRRVGISEVVSAVSAWDDQSGNGNHATQSTETNKPTWFIDYITGDTSDNDFLDFGAPLFPATTDWLCCLIFKTPSSTLAEDSLAVGQWDGADGNRFAILYDGATSTISLTHAATTIVSEVLSTDTVYGIVAYRDGNTWGLRSTSAGSWATASNSSSITQSEDLKLGVDSVANYMLNERHQVYDFGLWLTYSDPSRDVLYQRLKMMLQQAFSAALDTTSKSAQIAYSKSKPPEGVAQFAVYEGTPVSVGASEFIMARAFIDGHEPSALASWSNNDPSDISDLRLWLSSEWTSLSHGGGESSVSSWYDLGPDSDDFDAVGAPGYNKATLNGFTTASFDGDDCLDTVSGDALLTGNTARTLFVVAKSGVASSTDYNPVFEFSDQASPATGSSMAICFRRSLEIRTNGGFTRWNTEITNGVWTLLAVRWTGRQLGFAGTTSVRVNTRATNPLKSQSSGASTIIDTDSAGTGISRIGRAQWLDAYFQGSISDIILYDRALSVAEMQDVEAYLIARYQLDI